MILALIRCASQINSFLDRFVCLGGSNCSSGSIDDTFYVDEAIMKVTRLARAEQWVILCSNSRFR